MTRSPSAAFGRLRIDSPAAAHIRSAARRRSLTAGIATEQSPLILRELKSLPSDSSLPTSSPAFYIWIGPALVCALMYALYNICIKKGSNSIHPVLGGVILQFVAAILGSVLLGALIWKQGGYEDMPCDTEGITWAVFAGMAVGAAEILSFIVSGMGVQAMQSIPIIIGGSVLFGTTLGFTVLKESLSCRGWSGVFLIAMGITLVGIDPGACRSCCCCYFMSRGWHEVFLIMTISFSCANRRCWIGSLDGI